jgi:ankyrin repeat protein
MGSFRGGPKPRQYEFSFKLFCCVTIGMIELLQASEVGDLERVKSALKIEQQNNAEDQEPSFFINEALRLSSENGHLEVVKYLVENGADNINNPLRVSSENEHLSVVKYLVEKGADIHISDDYPLRVSVDNGNIDMVKFFISSGANLDASKGEALLTSISDNRNDIANLLLSSGADIHIDDDYALNTAVQVENIEMVNILIKYGADIHAEEDRVLIQAIISGNYGIVEILVEYGADVNTQDNAPIEVACENGNLKIVKLLVNSGADPIYNDALIFSSERNYIDIVKYLLKNEADVTRKEYAALRFSSSRGHLEIVELLVQNGSNIHAKNEYSLRKSSEYGFIEVVKYLIEKGADPRASNNEALILSSKNGHFEVVKLLVNSGAEVTADGSYALVASILKNNQKIAEFLVNSGADVNAWDASAIKTATIYGNLSLVKFLIEHGSTGIQEAIVIARDKKHDDILKFLNQFNKGLLKRSAKKIISLYKDKKIFYKWQKICSSLNNRDLVELRNLANLHGITDTGSKKKQDICKILTAQYQEQMLKPVECHNETTILGDPIALIPKPLLFTVKEGKFNYCFNILELVESLKAGDSRNPWTRKELPVAEIEKAMLRLREILIESKMSFVNILEEIENNDIMDKAGIFKFSVVNLISKLRYPPSVEDVIKMDPERVKQMFALLKENPLTKVYGPETLDNLI